MRRKILVWNARCSGAVCHVGMPDLACMPASPPKKKNARGLGTDLAPAPSPSELFTTGLRLFFTALQLTYCTV